MRRQRPVLTGWCRAGRKGPRERRPRHVLDVRILSRKEVRIRREEHAKLALKVGAVLVLCIGAAAGARTVVRDALQHGEEVRLRQIEVRTNGRLTREAVLAATGLREGENILRIDLAEVQGRLLELPQVYGAAVARTLPGRISVAVRERIPLAWLESRTSGVMPQNSESGFLIDEQGELFACEVLERDLLTLPRIRIEDAVRVQEGVRLSSEGVTAAIALLKETPAYLGHGDWDIVAIEVEKDFYLRVDFRNQARAAFWCHDRDRQLADLRAIVEYAEASDRVILTADLRMWTNIPVRFHDPDADPGESESDGDGDGLEDLPSAVPVSAVKPLAGREPPSVPAADRPEPPSSSAGRSAESRAERQARQVRGIIGGL